MNLTRIALVALAALVAYFVVGGIFFMVPAMQAEFAKYPAVYRSGEAINSVMAVGMFGILRAIVAATVIFARMHPRVPALKRASSLAFSSPCSCSAASYSTATCS